MWCLTDDFHLNITLSLYDTITLIYGSVCGINMYSVTYRIIKFFTINMCISLSSISYDFIPVLPRRSCFLSPVALLMIPVSLRDTGL